MIKPFAAVLVVLSFAAAACSDTVDPVTNHFDCNDICESWKSCSKDDGYDVDACRDRCEKDASDNDNKQTKLDNCHKCLDDNDNCLSEATMCATSCSAFVP